jgi:hypothetical protein
VQEEGILNITALHLIEAEGHLIDEVIDEVIVRNKM